MTIKEVEKIEYKLLEPITFISSYQVTESEWIKAENLVSDIDPKDSP